MSAKHASDVRGQIGVLDPACGDGNLLCAINEALPREMRRRVTLIGVENDDVSFASLRARQQKFNGCHTELVKGDFLEFFGDNDLFGSHEAIEPVDCIIANPPYVRTQVLGAKRAQQLAARFGQSGRVDLYQAFLVAMSRQLRPRGILGVITSNRFLTTRGGMATRRFPRTRFDLLEIADLGDTKLFEAAVLLSRKEKLESREYVISAGRAWYEIWVPQDPQAWSLPKIVFPDISPDARFFWDAMGSIVDGNCYWITTNDPADEELPNGRGRRIIPSRTDV